MYVYMAFIWFFTHENEVVDFHNIYAQMFKNTNFVDFPTLFSVEIYSIFITNMAALFNGGRNATNSSGSCVTSPGGMSDFSASKLAGPWFREDQIFQMLENFYVSLAFEIHYWS